MSSPEFRPFIPELAKPSIPKTRPVRRDVPEIPHPVPTREPDPVQPVEPVRTPEKPVPVG